MTSGEFSSRDRYVPTDAEKQRTLEAVNMAFSSPRVRSELSEAGGVPALGISWFTPSAIFMGNRKANDGIDNEGYIELSKFAKPEGEAAFLEMRNYAYNVATGTLYVINDFFVLAEIEAYLTAERQEAMREGVNKQIEQGAAFASAEDYIAFRQDLASVDESM